MNRKLFLIVLFAVALVALFGIAINAQAHDHVYVPSHPGAPMWSYYTGDYGSHTYVPSPRYYAPTYVPRYQSHNYSAPRVRVYWGGGGVDVGRVHVRW